MLELFNRLTLTRQWIIATLLAMLPLVVATTYAGWSLSEQTRTQKELVETIGKLNRLDTALNDQLTEFQRSGRQYLLIQNPKFLTLFERDLLTLENYSGQLASLLPKADVLSLLNNILERANTIKTRISEHHPGESTQDILTYLKRSNRDMNTLSGVIQAHNKQLLNESDKTFQATLQHLLLIGILAVPGTILLVVISAVTVVRPMWRLGKAIQSLGHGYWETPIHIEGPADLTALGENLEWMRTQLVASEKQKHAFLMHITHELKTPLAAITEAGSLLYDEVPGEICLTQRQVLDILLSNADNLQVLIQQLLNYNAVAHGLMHTQAEISLREICEKIRDKLTLLHQSIEKHWIIEGEDRHIDSDPHAVEMILTNLLSNAHDFTANNGTIRIDWQHDTSHSMIRVSDNGPGLDEEEMTSIYKPFYQGKSKRTGPLKGSGMGLAIVKACVTHLQGDITVESTLNEGTTFTVTLPNKSHVTL